MENYIFFESHENNERDEENLENFINFYYSNYELFYKPLKEKSFLIYNEDIREIIQKRTLFLDQSLEIFLKNGKSYFFNFFNKEKVKTAYAYFNEINEKLLKTKFSNFKFNTNYNEEDIRNLVQSFHKGKISNYKYLLKLNKYATRTYNDISQYPVFPWLVKSYEKIPEIFKLLESKELPNNIDKYFRIMKYSMMGQTKKDREEAVKTFLEGRESFKNLIEDESEAKKFHSHFYNHYSASAYIVYYLMRMNPYEESLIKLQTDQFEVAARMFNGFTETEQILETNADNRELIPDFFSYCDYFSNLNCCFFGKKQNSEYIVDDINLKKMDSSEYTNVISGFVNSLYNNRKLLNNTYVSKILSEWVDNIFGKNQLPEKIEDRFKSFNMYNKICYEQITNIEKKFEKLCKKYKSGKLSINKFMEKAHDKKSSMIEFGMNPKQILFETVTYEGKPKTFENVFKSIRGTNEEKYFYFNRINSDNFILIKEDIKNKNKSRVAIIFNNKNFKEKESNIYDCRGMNLYQIKNKNENDIPLFNINYAFVYLIIQIEKLKIPIFLSCRYLDNYFKIQSNNLIINIYVEDYVTCIKSLSETSNIFYTGLLNGKLSKWKIWPCLDNTDKIKKSKFPYNLKVEELKSVYAHKSAITAIELYSNQNIIITAGEDKFIYIRKIFDFELLTSIDLTYCYGNPIVSQANNIFPFLIKVSELNLLYVLIYDNDKKNTFIRGYNLNGLLFAQTNNKVQYNSISFTKYNNLIVGSYNSNSIQVLSASSLTNLWEKKNKNEDPKLERQGTKCIEYNNNYGEFYILYKNEFIIMTLKEKDEIKEFESY